MAKLSEIITYTKNFLENNFTVDYFPTAKNIIGDRIPMLLVGIDNDTKNAEAGSSNYKIEESTFSVFIYSNRIIKDDNPLYSIQYCESVEEQLYKCLDEMQASGLICEYTNLNTDFGSDKSDNEKTVTGYFGDFQTTKITVTINHKSVRY